MEFEYRVYYWYWSVKKRLRLALPSFALLVAFVLATRQSLNFFLLISVVIVLTTELQLRYIRHRRRKKFATDIKACESLEQKKALFFIRRCENMLDEHGWRGLHEYLEGLPPEARASIRALPIQFKTSFVKKLLRLWRDFDGKTQD